MRVVDIEERPLLELFYLNAGPKGRTQTERLPILRATVDKLPAELDALLVTSDLQGVATSPRTGEQLLLGEVLAERLVDAKDKKLPSPAHTGVLLAGDLYSDPQAKKRGATGDVRSVWEAFLADYRWVVGVAGNHDTFGTNKERSALSRSPDLHIFDGDVRSMDGLSIGGVSGIIGASQKNERKPEELFLSMLVDVLAKQPEVVVLHQGPPGDLPGQQGYAEIGAFIDIGRPCLTICGHSHWSRPLADRPGGRGQVLNVDARAVLLQRA